MNDLLAQYAQYIPLLIPVVLLQVGLMIAALLDLSRQTTTRGPKWAWICVIALFNLIGPIAYFFWGRQEE